MGPPRPIAGVATALAGLLLLGCAGAPAPSDPAPASPTGASGPAGTGTSAGADEVDGWPTASPASLGFRGERFASLAAEARRKDSSCYAGRPQGSPGR